MLIHIGPLHGMCSRRVEREILGRRCDFSGIRAHWSLEDILPEGAEIHVVSTTIIEQIAINGIVRLAR